MLGLIGVASHNSAIGLGGGLYSGVRYDEETGRGRYAWRRGGDRRHNR